MDEMNLTTKTKAYLRFLDDGLTFDGQVWRAGAVCETDDIAFAALEPLEQRRRYGTVFFELISEEEYRGLKDLPAQSIRTPVRHMPLSPAPPATGYNDEGVALTVDPGKVNPVALHPAHTVAPVQITEMLPDEEQPAVGEQAPFFWYEAADDLETVSLVARMNEQEVADFLAHEKANRNRPTIVKLIETGELDG